MWLETEIDQLEKDVKLVEAHPFIYLERSDVRTYEEIIAEESKLKDLEVKKSKERKEKEKDDDSTNQQMEQPGEEKKEDDEELNILNY